MNTQFHNKKKKRKEKRFRFLDFRVFFAIFGALILSSQLIFAQGITIPSGSTINVNTGTLDVGGSVTNAGTLLLTSGAVELQGDWTNSGTFTAGSGTVQFDATTGTQNLTSGGTGVGNLFYNLSHTDAGTVEVLANDLDINNNFTNSSGAFDTNGNDMTVAGAW
ncbi:MAG: hypothetical protein KC618_08275, partial [Candidatus Omnitrophica bacterium]|nr:hypothetical protein [Candidatus Omnitrophota bacterium]